MKKFWTKTGKLFSLLLATCAAFTACTDDNEDFRQSANKALDIQVAVKPTSRAMVMGTALPEGAQIGVNVTATDGSEYDGQNVGYLNVAYTATGTDATQTWGSTAPVMLSGTEGKLYAYYPYTADIDYTAVEVDIADQHDWMVGTEAYNVSDKAPSVDVVLAHAQTALNINVIRDDAYTGAGEVTVLAITSEGLASTGTLDTRDGSWSAVDGANTAISIISAPFTLDGTTLTNQENPYMFIPASDETKGFTVNANVDGKAYNVGVAMNEVFAPGKMYKLNVKVTNTGLTVSKVTLIDWNIDTTLPESTLQPEQEIDYSTWIKATYNVTDNSTATQIFGSTNNFDVANVAEMAVLEGSASRAASEPQVVTPATTYQFSTTGTHTVYVKFTDMTQIPEWVFFECTGLIDFEFPESIQTIGNNAFCYCTGLKDVTVPNSVQTIGEEAFFECTGLTVVTIGSGVRTIGKYAFYRCTGLTSVWMGEGMETIGTRAFYECTGLTSVTIGSGVKTIGDYAFQGCESLQEITITESVTKIGTQAFSYCTGLSEVIIPNSVKTIGDWAFSNCTGLTEVTIGNSVTTIGKLAFSYCTGLKNVSIGNSVKTIGGSAFEHCKELQSIIVNENNSNFDSRGGCNAIMETATNTLIQGCNNTIIPQDCETIGEYAFYECTGLTEVTIPNSVTSIEKRAFWDCTGLTSVTIGSGVETIRDRAFSGCKGLEEVTIGSGVQTIGEYAFEWCTKLNSITSLAATAPSIHSTTFIAVQTGGKLYVPQSATGYNVWMGTGDYYLGKYNWTKETITE